MSCILHSLETGSENRESKLKNCSDSWTFFPTSLGKSSYWAQAPHRLYCIPMQSRFLGVALLAMLQKIRDWRIFVSRFCTLWESWIMTCPYPSSPFPNHFAHPALAICPWYQVTNFQAVMRREFVHYGISLTHALAASTLKPFPVGISKAGAADWSSVVCYPGAAGLLWEANPDFIRRGWATKTKQRLVALESKQQQSKNSVV